MRAGAPAKRRIAPAPPRATAIEAMPLGHAGMAVRDGIAGSLLALSRTEAEIVALVRSAVSSGLGVAATGVSELGRVVGDVIDGASRAVENAGTALVASTKSIAKGVMLGVHDVRGDLGIAATETVRALVKHVAAAGGDVGVAARHAIDGIIDATMEAGGDVGQVARRAARSAVKQAGEVGTRAARAASDMVAGAVAGIHPRARRPVVHVAARTAARHAARRH